MLLYKKIILLKLKKLNIDFPSLKGELINKKQRILRFHRLTSNDVK